MAEIKPLSGQERAFFAGYTDAEGCIRVWLNHGRFWQAGVSFQQNDPSVIIRLRDVYGGAIYKRGNKKSWQLRRYAAVACFLQDILPYVGEKRAQIEAVLNRFSSRMPTEDGMRLVADLRAMKKAPLDPNTLPPKKEQQKCAEPGCTRKALVRGLCGMHYQHYRYRKQIEIGPPRPLRKFVYKVAPKVTDLAYIAGYMDGDGHIGMAYSHGRWRVNVAFNQCCADGILRMHAIYGGGLAYRKQAPPNRPSLCWILASHNAVLAFLHDIQPFAIEKRNEIDLVLNNYRDDLSLEEGNELVAKLKKMREPAQLDEELGIRQCRPRLEVAVIASIRRGTTGVVSIARDIQRRTDEVSAAIDKLVKEGTLKCVSNADVRRRREYRVVADAV